jgi:TIR domain
MMKVFLTYTRDKDVREAVTRFHAEFLSKLRKSERRSQVFMDSADIIPGDDFEWEIKRRLHQADLLVVFLSPEWLESDWCRKEFEWFVKERDGLHRHRPILPVLWRKTPALDAPAKDKIVRILQKLQYDDWRNIRRTGWENDPEPLQRLGRLVDAAIAQVRARGGTPGTRGIIPISPSDVRSTSARRAASRKRAYSRFT